uniref:Uncharacterized protein n=1 Tax=Anopheles darlingi TaxID=43151 RepID=A0A2M4D2F3_ANODA
MMMMMRLAEWMIIIIIIIMIVEGNTLVKRAHFPWVVTFFSSLYTLVGALLLQVSRRRDRVIHQRKGRPRLVGGWRHANEDRKQTATGDR